MVVATRKYQITIPESVHEELLWNDTIRDFRNSRFKGEKVWKS